MVLNCKITCYLFEIIPKNHDVIAENCLKLAAQRLFQLPEFAAMFVFENEMQVVTVHYQSKEC